MRLHVIRKPKAYQKASHWRYSLERRNHKCCRWNTHEFVILTLLHLLPHYLQVDVFGSGNGRGRDGDRLALKCQREASSRNWVLVYISHSDNNFWPRSCGLYITIHRIQFKGHYSKLIYESIHWQNTFIAYFLLNSWDSKCWRFDQLNRKKY